MTQLYIDNQEVALPEDFTFDLIKENPFFTKGGSFTLDISINLDIPVNAILYRHLNRFTASSIFKNRSARLIVDGRTVLNGTEIILEVNELSASIQLASGNSELNFIVGEDLKMSDLDMGTIPILTIDQAKESMSMSYPECNYVCAPAKARNGSEVIFLNNLPEQILYFNKSMNTIIWENSHKAEPSEIRPMLYLNFAIEKCIETLGYTIKKNILRETVYNRLFVVYGSKPSAWSELFGKKTVLEFLSDVEYLFGVNIIVSGKSVEILFRNDFYDNYASVFCPKMVEDRFERTYLSEDEQIVSYNKSNISYELQDNTYFKMQNVDQEIRSELPEIHQASLEGLKNLIKSANEQDLSKLYRCILIDDDTKTEFVLIKDENLGAHLNIVNRFGALIRQSNKNEIKLNIVPVEIEYPTVLFQYYSKDPLTGKENITGTSSGHITLPVVEKYVFSEDVGITAEEAINGKQMVSQEIERISVAFWNGCKKIDMVVGEGSPIFPMPTTHYIAPWIYNYYKPLDETKASLSLPDLNKDIYQNTTLFDVEKEHTIHALLESGIPSATDIWNVNNKEFVCKSIQFKITPDGFDPEYQATLYSKT